MLKKILDYIPKLKELYPNICESDIRRCVNYGWKMFYYYNLLGCDTVCNDPKLNLWFYCGNLYDNSILYFTYYRKKLLNKIRTMHHRKRLKWDGYYYVIVDKPKKRKIANYIIENKYIFKLLDEAKLFYHNAKYFIRFKYPINLGYRKYKKKMNIKNAEIVYIREKPTTFKDILYNENEYKLQ